MLDRDGVRELLGRAAFGQAMPRTEVMSRAFQRFDDDTCDAVLALVATKVAAAVAAERDVTVSLFNLVSDVWNAESEPDMQRAFKHLAADPELMLAPSGRKPGGLILKRHAAIRAAQPTAGERGEG